MKSRMFDSHGFRCAAICLTLLLCGQVAAGDDEEPKPAQENTPTKIDFARDIQPIFAEHCTACHGSKVEEGSFRLDLKSHFFRGGDSGKLVVPGKSGESLLLARVAGDDEGDRMPLDADPLNESQIALLRKWIDQGAVWPDDVKTDAVKHWAFVKPQRQILPTVKQNVWVRNPIDAFILARLEAEGVRPSPEATKEQLLRRVSFDLTGLPPTITQIDAFLADDSPDAYEKVVDRLLASPRYGERWALPWLDAARFADSNGYQRDGRREAWAFRDWVIRALNSNMPFDQFTIQQIAGDLLPEPTLAQRIATGFNRGTMANVEAGTDTEEQRVLAIFDRVNTTGTVWLGVTIQCAQCHDHKYDPFSQTDYYRLFAFFNNTEVEIEEKNSARDFIGPKLKLPEPATKTSVRQLAEAELKAVGESLKTLAEQLKLHQSQWEKNLPHLAKSEEKIPADIQAILDQPSENRDESQKKSLAAYYLKRFDSYTTLEKRQTALQKRVTELAADTALVMSELPQPRMTQLFKRGDFLNPGETVPAGAPEVLHPLKKSDNPNRLDLARWLIDTENPLVARVTVNRYWAEFFGRGLVETPEDFGTQGSRPTHPQLLDWLATEFVRNGWNVKAIHRLIATSATYRQASKMTPAVLQRDPYNALYTRGPRVRLRAELIRDNALAVSGLLSDKMHGPPVFPRQPDGVWNHIGRASNLWKTSNGEDLYRRGVYVYWRRTVPYPSFVNFDAPSREMCVVKRNRSNTPLQALTLMNDPVFFEAAAGLARRLCQEQPQADPADRIRYAFRLAAGRHPHQTEIEILQQRYEQEFAGYQADPDAAEKMAKHWNPSDTTNTAEFAAWMHVTNIILNLDEVITKG